ncbi:FAD-dependent oxidoreductase [Desulfococcaceae bacterium HSG7]|nr:FAD-dependent oxidoreductase [Desulfococcaceae bacterium HSG7]
MNEQANMAWRCTVCGYVHRGPEPQDECSVCGSPKELFELYQESGSAKTALAPENWRCLVCNYVHSGELPPAICPVCGSPAERFEAIAESARTEPADAKHSDRIVVIGAGIAGISAVETIRQHSENAAITLLTKEPHQPYYRLNLTRFLAGEIAEESLPIHSEEWYAQNQIDLITDVQISNISSEAKQVSSKDGTVYEYDKLILTAGAHPFIPPIPGAAMEGATTLRNLNDAKYILNEAQNAKSIVVIGGGVLGLETAGALVRQSADVTLLEGFDWLMPRQLNKTAAKLLKTHIESIGIKLMTGVTVQELKGDERVAGVQLKDGAILPADLVIVTAGVRSNSYLARLAGLSVNSGVIVNDFMLTSTPAIYAAGDIAEHRGIVYGLWNAAQYQGSIAGMNALGKNAEFGGIPRSNSLKVLGVDLLSIGRFMVEDGRDSVIEAECEGNYSRYIFRDSRMVGCILYGNTVISGEVKKAIENNYDFSGLLKQRPDAATVWDFFHSD